MDYLFAQVMVNERRVDTTPNCGNMLCAVGPFAVTAEEFGAAWGYLLGEWLPQSGYVPAEGVCFETGVKAGEDAQVARAAVAALLAHVAKTNPENAA